MPLLHSVITVALPSRSPRNPDGRGGVARFPSPDPPMALSAGDPAPDVTLYDDQMAPFTLSDERTGGPVVLLFFPGAFTSVCTTELNTVANDYARYEEEAENILTDLGFHGDIPPPRKRIRITKANRSRVIADWATAP